MSLLTYSLPRAWDTASAALCVCAHALGDARGVGEIAAASGLAWRSSVDDVVSLAGPHAYPFAEVLAAAAARLGYLCEVVTSSERPGGVLRAQALAHARQLIERGAEAGRPTMIWGVHAPEFGLALGLDGEQLHVSGILDGAAPSTLDFTALGRGDVPILFALQLTEKAAAPEPEATLEAALLFGRGPAPTLSGFYTGAATWRAVSAALTSGRVDPAGLAYSAQRWAESRAFAAAWLKRDPELAAAREAFGRAASMLAELAKLHPFPPPPGFMFTNPLRDQSSELVAEAASAESAGLDALSRALTASEKRAVDRLTLADLDPRTLPDLFACVRELPVDDLSGDAQRCRERGRLSGKLLYDGDRQVGHILWAPLEDAQQPVVAVGRRWFVFCPWVARERRGRGAGPRLMAALEAEARAAGVDGLLTFATDDERFLYVESLAKLGFVEIGRRNELRLFERTLSDQPSFARFSDPPSGESARVVVRHAYHCPLLLHTRRRLAEAARAAGLSVDESDQPPAGARIDGRELPHGYVPLAALTAHLRSL